MKTRSRPSITTPRAKLTLSADQIIADYRLAVRSRAASEALGVLLLLAGVLAALSLYSYDPRDPNLFSLTTGEAESPTNWIGGFGASLSAALYQALGFAAWTTPVLLAFWGFRRFTARPIENRGSKAVGIALLFLAVPALLLMRRRR